jgi:ribosome-associated heat shock protein Hsp15
MTELALTKVRVDKWLWAARFFRTRGLAKQAIEGGKVYLNGHRTKPGKELKIGASVVIKRGWQTTEIVVTKLAEQRRGSSEAVNLYYETPASLTQREQTLADRKTRLSGYQPSSHRPSKKQRRQIHRFNDLD